MKNKSPFSLGVGCALVALVVISVPMLLASWASWIVSVKEMARADTIAAQVELEKARQESIEAEAQLETAQAIARQLDAGTDAIIAGTEAAREDTRIASSPLVVYSGAISAASVAIVVIVVATCAAIVVVMARRLRRLEATLEKVAQSGASSGDSGAPVGKNGVGDVTTGEKNGNGIVRWSQ